MERRPDWTAGHPVLLVSACGRCGNHWYLPRSHCPVCGAADIAEVPSGGTGLCVALTRLHTTQAGSRDGEPLRLALVELDEGPVVMGRVHDDELVPGDRAALAFRPVDHDGALVPSFAQEDRPA